jgi:MarR family transcriptional regulator, 2-MHQ and catechol-resistance regulon repressor
MTADLRTSLAPRTRRALKLFVVLSRAAAAADRHAKEDVARHGIGMTEFAILELLYHRGPQLLGEVQRKILVTSGGVTYLVDRLEEKGLIERRACPEDRRARYAALTAAGERLIGKIFPGHAERLEHALSGLTSAEQDEAIRLLRKAGLHAQSLLDGEGG